MTSQQPTPATGATTPAELPQTKAEVRARREELRRALVELEEVLNVPAGDRERWRERVGATVERMHTTIQHHVRDTESSGGMLEQVQDDAPWLEGRVEQLRKEHDALLERAAALAARCREGAEASDVREEALDLLQRVSRHRHMGTDLLYDAYMVDISAAD